MHYRFLDSMGEVVAQGDYADHSAAVEAACDDADPDLGELEINRVEYLGPEGDWRWAGPLHG